VTEPHTPALALWSDDPAPTDLLSFDAVAATIAEALLDEALDPVALGLSGTWGSGKTTVLGLVEQELTDRADEQRKVLVLETDPWRYDPTTGAKESLIGEVLVALANEIDETQSTSEEAKKTARALAVRLAKRIDWAKAIKLTAKTSLAFQIPSINEIVDLVKPPEPGEDEEEQVRGLDAFRDEFTQLMASEALAHVQAVAVLVDDLDRCLPETVIESLEAIRLFLAVPKMSFVIAADEERVADAIRTRFADTGASTDAEQDEKEPAKLYLHKIVQTTIPLPALSRFDTQAFLLLLQLQQRLSVEQVTSLIDQCAEVRRAGGDLDDLTGLDGVELSEELAIASRLTPILYEKLRGNPRRIKRFLNDLRVRQSIASRRGIDLKAAIVAKLMVLEVLLPEEFNEVLGWLAQGTMRDQLIRLDASAGKPVEAASETETAETSARPGKTAVAKNKRPTSTPPAEKTSEFSESMLRWAKLPPALAGEDLSPYLFLAAAFAGTPLLDDSLPERLRDIAANLLSSSRADQRAVTEGDLTALSRQEGEALLMHLGRTVRDQPGRQKTGVTGVLRIARQHAELVPAAKKALVMLPGEEVTAGTPLLFAKDDHSDLFAALEQWKGSAARQPIIAAIDDALQQQGGA